MALFFGSVISQSRTIIKELLEEHHRGIIPKEHIGFFASLVRFSNRYKLPKKLTPKAYAKLGVHLAFKKYDYHVNPTPVLLQEINLLREQLKEASEYTPDSLNLRYGR